MIYAIRPDEPPRRCFQCGTVIYLVRKSRGSKRSPQMLVVDCRAQGLVHPTSSHWGKGVKHDCPARPTRR